VSDAFDVHTHTLNMNMIRGLLRTLCNLLQCMHTPTHNTAAWVAPRCPIDRAGSFQI
jgi:hypothetical protein